MNMPKRPKTSPEMFSPTKMAAIVEQLKAQGKLPSEEEFVRSMGKMREKYRSLFLAAREKSELPHQS